MNQRTKPYAFFSILAITLFSLTTLHAEPAKGSDQQAKPKLAHVYQNAHILANRGLHTVVPLRSIIYLPTKDKANLVEIPSGKFRFWPDFLAKNRSWLTTYEVTLDQAKGLKPIPEEKIEELAKINRTVIATYRRNPISVRPPKVDSPDAADSEKNQGKKKN